MVRKTIISSSVACPCLVELFALRVPRRGRSEITGLPAPSTSPSPSRARLPARLPARLVDLFLLFIYVEIIGMIGAFYSTSRIPVTLPIIVAITALCRLIVMQSKEMDATVLLAEAGAILVLSAAAYLMSLKDKISLQKLDQEKDA